MTVSAVAALVGQTPDTALIAVLFADTKLYVQCLLQSQLSGL